MTSRAVSTPRARSKRAPHARVRPSRPHIRPLVLFVLAVIIAFFAIIYSRISLDRTAFVLQGFEDQITIEEARHWDLRAEIARLEAPDRITARAESLGLVYPTERVSIRVPGIEAEEPDLEYRWAELRALLSSLP